MAKNTVRSVTIFINEKEVKNDIKSIRAEYFKLNNEINKTTRNTKEYNQKVKELNRVKGILDDHSNKVGRVQKAWHQVKSIFIGTSIANLATNMLQRITSAIPNAIGGLAKLSDEYARVGKTTGLTDIGVQKVNASLKKMDTRTAMSDLRSMAVIAGKLGMQGVKDIVGFVGAMNKINVALGEDLGDVETVSKQLGKLTTVYDLKQSHGIEQSLLRVGSALNELGANSEAAEANIVDFTTRMGGVAPLAKLSITDVMGMGAALDVLGQSAETSSTALSKVFFNMAGHIEEFAAVAGEDVTTFKELLENDMNEAFTKVLEGTNNSADGLIRLGKVLDKLGVEGGRTTGVFGVLAKNTEFLRAQQELAAYAFIENTSIMEEYNRMNETTAAKIEKLGKEFRSIGESKGLQNFLKSVIDLLIDFVHWTKENSKEIGQLVKVLSILSAGFLAIRMRLLILRSAWLANATAAATHYALMIRQIAATNGISVAMAHQKVVVETLRTSWNKLKLTIATNPFGVVFTVITAAVTAVVLLRKNIKGLTEQLEDMRADFENKNADDISARAEELNKEILAIEDITKTEAERLELIESFNKKYNESIKLGKEEIEVRKQLADAHDRITQAIEGEVIAENAKEKIAELDVKISDLKKLIEKMESGELKRTVPNISKTGNLAYTQENFDKDEIQKQKDRYEELSKARAQYLMDQVSGLGKAAMAKGSISSDVGTDVKDVSSLFDALQKRLTQFWNTAEANMDNYLNQVQNIIAQSNNNFKSLIQQQALNGTEGVARAIGEIHFKYEELIQAAKDFKDNAEVNAKIQLMGQQSDIDAEKIKVQELYEQKKISAGQFLDMQEQIKATEADIVDHYNTTIVGLEQFKNQAIKSLIAAKQLEYEMAREAAKQEVLDFYQQFVADSNAMFAEFSAHKAAYKAELARKLLDFKEYRKQLNIENNAALAAEIYAIQQAYDARIAAAQKAYEEATKLGLAEAEELKDRLVALENQKNEEIELAVEAHNQRQTEILFETLNEQAQIYGSYANQIIGIFDNLASARKKREDSELMHFKNAKNAELKILEDAFKAKRISETKYQNEKLRLAQEIENKERDMRIRQYKREKALALSQAIINGALAVSVALASAPPPVNFITAGISAIAAGIQIAKIATEPMPIFRKGGKLEGPSHEDGGLSIINSQTGKKVAEAEGGEVFLSGETYRNNQFLIDMLLDSSMNKGGAKVPLSNIGGYDNVPTPNWRTSTNNVMRAEKGGLFVAPQSTPTTNASPVNTEVSNTRIDRIEEMFVALMQKLSEKDKIQVEAYVRLDRLKEANKDEEIISSTASLTGTGNRSNRAA